MATLPKDYQRTKTIRSHNPLFVVALSLSIGCKATPSKMTDASNVGAAQIYEDYTKLIKTNEFKSRLNEIVTQPLNSSTPLVDAFVFQGQAYSDLNQRYQRHVKQNKFIFTSKLRELINRYPKTLTAEDFQKALEIQGTIYRNLGGRESQNLFDSRLTAAEIARSIHATLAMSLMGEIVEDEPEDRSLKLFWPLLAIPLIVTGAAKAAVAITKKNREKLVKIMADEACKEYTKVCDDKKNGVATNDFDTKKFQVIRDRAIQWESCKTEHLPTDQCDQATYDRERDNPTTHYGSDKKYSICGLFEYKCECDKSGRCAFKTISEPAKPEVPVSDSEACNLKEKWCRKTS